VGDRSSERRAQLVDYLRRIAAGESGAEAAAAFGDLGALESELRAYSRKLLLPYMEMALPEPPADDQLQTRDLPPAEVAAMAALFRLNGRQTDDGVEELVAFALQGAPELAETRVAAGILHALKARYAEAEQAFEHAVRIDGGSALGHYGLAVVRLYRDRSPEGLADAEQHLAKAQAADPRLAPAKARLAEVYRRTDGCSERALPPIRGAAALGPGRPSYLLKEAQIHPACGRAEQARARLRPEVEEAVDSESSSRNNQLCWSGSLWGLAAEVMSACERAVELRPESHSILDSRAVARALTGDLAGAAADLRAALKLAGESGWDEPSKAKRAGWLRRLEAGVSPFAGDGPAALGDDPEEAGLGWCECALSRRSPGGGWRGRCRWCRPRRRSCRRGTARPGRSAAPARRGSGGWPGRR
jgi:tetratricopeptide (TPR) repeat protein